ncbi:hypothetical protein J3F84DRAFT_365334 [Trichoderma pleuroticola]
MMGSNGPRRHRCLVCQRHFKRTEHLTRHLRRHTQEKPYQCQECLQCFARKELYQRHQQEIPWRQPRPYPAAPGDCHTRLSTVPD